ncbi:variable surface protein Vir22/12-related [Plasmodium vivax]|uniref:Variable surface protein Vir22/12-related n=1 Tax=Plasmodium vivax (strain Salvador I) TaxID=126793 RepID=A5KAS0_PLAVS|nr:variable surface protein Vir22/12-related [Plasmodium vivax]EDL43437.1 variable surface protein Vir22/12-related [Plasmodium vivax]|eukprot:XP_001613164.1 variable surface protein Vir22/12-related [Plasmodium vivax Sal-1]
MVTTHYETFSQEKIISEYSYLSCLLFNFQDSILNNLPSYNSYKEFNETVQVNNDDTECKDLEDKTATELCAKFIRNIKKLPDSKNKTKEHNVKALDLIYWILDELRKYSKSNSRNTNVINKIVSEGNSIYNKKYSYALFYDYKFDLEESRKEKLLHDYFKNYEQIKSCENNMCETYYKYVSYIRDIYYEHQLFCLESKCDYFIHNPKYDPNDVLSKLEECIGKLRKAESNTISALSRSDQVNLQKSKPNINMIIKYVSCTKVKDNNDKDTIKYKCEDPAYRQHTEKGFLGQNVKKNMENVTFADAFKKLNSKNCTKFEHNGMFGFSCLNTGLPKGLKETAPSSTVTDLRRSTKIVDPSAGIREYLESDNMVPGVKFLASNRDVSEIWEDYENSEEKINSDNLRPISMTTLFPEFSKNIMEKYIDKDMPKCQYYKFVKGKLICVNPIGARYDMNNVLQKDYITTKRGSNVIIREEREFSKPSEENTTTTPFFNMQRTLIIAALLAGMFFVLFIYIKERCKKKKGE